MKKLFFYGACVVFFLSIQRDLLSTKNDEFQEPFGSFDASTEKSLSPTLLNISYKLKSSLTDPQIGKVLIIGRKSPVQLDSLEKEPDKVSLPIRIMPADRYMVQRRIPIAPGKQILFVERRGKDGKICKYMLLQEN